MSPRTVRRMVLVVCVAGIAGMIASSVADSTGGALSFGLITAVAVIVLILVTAVTARAPGVPGHDDLEDLAERLEAQVGELVEAGADEAAVRALVGDAVNLGSARR